MPKKALTIAWKESKDASPSFEFSSDNEPSTIHQTESPELTESPRSTEATAPLTGGTSLQRRSPTNSRAEALHDAYSTDTPTTNNVSSANTTVHTNRSPHVFGQTNLGQTTIHHFDPQVSTKEPQTMADQDPLRDTRPPHTNVPSQVDANNGPTSGIDALKTFTDKWPNHQFETRPVVAPAGSAHASMPNTDYLKGRSKSQSTSSTGIDAHGRPLRAPNRSFVNTSTVPDQDLLHSEERMTERRERTSSTLDRRTRTRDDSRSRANVANQTDTRPGLPTTSTERRTSGPDRQVPIPQVRQPPKISLIPLPILRPIVPRMRLNTRRQAQNAQRQPTQRLASPRRHHP